ncbi:MAG: SMC family ATPase [Thermoplasmata archaeon]
MQLGTLRLHNIRSYRDAKIRLERGTTLVSGDVGSGKTSLLYAIEMALFGLAEVDATFLVRHGASAAWVELTLVHEAHQYTLRRELLRKSRRGRFTYEPGEGTLIVDRTRTRYPPTELRQRIIDLLGFPDNPNPRAHSDYWRWAVYVPQEKMREVLSQRPEERLASVRKALGVEQYQTAAENAVEVAKELRHRSELRRAEADRLAFFDGELDRSSADIEREGSRLAEIDRAERELAVLRSQLAERREVLQSERTILEEARVRARGLDARRAALTHRRESIVGRLDALVRSRRAAEADRDLGRAAADRLTILTAEADRLKEAQRHLARKREEGEAARREWAIATTTQRGLERSLHEISQTRARRESEAVLVVHELDALAQHGPRHPPAVPTRRSLPEIETDLKELSRLQDVEVGATAQLERQAVELGELIEGGVCPRCHQPVDTASFTTHRGDVDAALLETRARLSQLREQRTTLEHERASRERYERAFGRWEEVDAHRQSLLEAQRRADARLQETRQREVEERSAIDAAQAKVTQLADAGTQADRWASEAEELDRLQHETAEALHANRALVERGRAIEEMLSAYRDQLAAAAEERAGVDAEVLRLATEADMLIQQLSRAEALESEVNAHQVRTDELEGKARELGATRARSEALLGAARQRLEQAARGRAERLRLVKDSGHLQTLAEGIHGPFRETLLKLERRLLTRAHSEFDHLLRRYFSTLVEDAALTAQADAAFSPAVEIEGEWTPPEALSGGERTALALAFRLALGHVVRSLGHLKLDTLILDEPTDGFSPEQVLRLGELLDEARVPQVLLISHEPQLTAIADHIVRVHKVDGVSRLGEEPGTEPRSAGAVSEVEVEGPPPEPERTTAASGETFPRPTVPRRRRRGSPLDAPDSSAPPADPSTPAPSVRTGSPFGPG